MIYQFVYRSVGDANAPIEKGEIEALTASHARLRLACDDRMQGMKLLGVFPKRPSAAIDPEKETRH